MVIQHGMSEEMGPVEYGENQEEVFLEDQLLKLNLFQKKLLKKLIKKLENLWMKDIIKLKKY